MEKFIESLYEDQVELESWVSNKDTMIHMGQTASPNKTGRSNTLTMSTGNQSKDAKFAVERDTQDTEDMSNLGAP